MDIRELDLASTEDLDDFVRLLDAYRMTPEGGGAALSPMFKDRLQDETSRHGNLIAFVAQAQGEPVGIVLGSYNLFVFSASPYAHVQFIFVRPEHQGHGVAGRLMRAFEEKARALGCCKLTLEVRETNAPAKALYSGLAYHHGSFGPHDDPLEFWEKPLA